MASFRWSLVQNDIDFVIEVDVVRFEKLFDWDFIVVKFSNYFLILENLVELIGRSCRERMDRVFEKYKFEEFRFLKRYFYILIIYREVLSFQLNKCFNILGKELRMSLLN